MKRKVAIAPSLLAADFARLGEETRAITRAGADYIHLDVMDGHFVPPITMGADMLRAVKPFSNKPFDVHLMVSPAANHLKSFAEAGADMLTVHPEADWHVHRLLQNIKHLGKRAGLALNPGSGAEKAAPLLDLTDLILVMSVNPGFGGQPFLESQLEKIARLRRMIDESGKPILLEVDGGVNDETAKKIRAAGADILVAGTAVFQGGESAYAANIARLRGETP